MTRYPPKTLLVPIDLSDASLSALKAAKMLGRAGGSTLELLYVDEVQPNLAVQYGGAELLRRDFARRAKFMRGKLEKLGAGYPGPVRITTAEGFASVILERLTRTRPDTLVVMGTHGYSGWRRALYGSMAETVVRVSKLPVLSTHHRTAPLRVRKILVPTNLTPYAERAFRYAQEVAAAHGARVDALSVCSERAQTRETQDKLLARLEKLDPSRRVRAIVRSGDPVRGILDEAASRKYDLIVLSAHRKPFFKDLALGMTAERVVRLSPVPVLAVPSTGRGTARPKDVRLEKTRR